jgi:hypothetical protein
LEKIKETKKKGKTHIEGNKERRKEETNHTERYKGMFSLRIKNHEAFERISTILESSMK